jgi:hypothetical protein
LGTGHNCRTTVGDRDTTAGQQFGTATQLLDNSRGQGHNCRTTVGG